MSGSEQPEKLRSYLRDTYRLLNEAETTLLITVGGKERAELRTKISEYELFLEKSQRELIEFEKQNAEATEEKVSSNQAGKDSEFGPAYYFELARKAYAQALFSEAIRLCQIVKNHHPYYPGIEAFEYLARQASESEADNFSSSLSKLEPREIRTPSIMSARLSRRGFWGIVMGALTLIAIVASVTIILTNPGNANESSSQSTPIWPNAITRQIIVHPPATEAPFLAATPTPPIQPSVPPAFFGTPG